MCDVRAEDDLITHADGLMTGSVAGREHELDRSVPEEIVNGGGYGMARFALRKEDCSLRVAYTHALSEMRANGMVSFILRKYGLGDRNLSMYKLNP